MPRIKADSVAEHVALQQAAVLDAAVELFIERGYSDVGLADIAAKVGLARNSLYRYVPDKSRLLVEWYRRKIPQSVEAWTAATAGDDPPAARLQRWTRAYLSWALTPEHRLVGQLSELLPSLDDATRAEISALHASMMRVVAGVVAEAGVPIEQVDAVVDLLSGAVLGVARAEQRSGPDDLLRRRLDAVVVAAIGIPGA